MRAYIIIYARVYAYFLLHQFSDYIKIIYWESVIYEENAKTTSFLLLNIWSIRKKAVPLHPISRSTQASDKRQRNTLKMLMLKIS